VGVGALVPAQGGGGHPPPPPPPAIPFCHRESLGKEILKEIMNVYGILKEILKGILKELMNIGDPGGIP